MKRYRVTKNADKMNFIKNFYSVEFLKFITPGKGTAKSG